MNVLCGAAFAELVTVWGIERTVFWPYFAGIVLSIVGLTMIVGREVPQAKGLDKVVVFGRLFLAVPMAIFGAEHFVFWRAMVPMVPSWIPWHTFWLLLVGTALIAAATSIIVKRYAGLAATLLATMIFSFVLLIHIPNLIATSGDRFRLAVALRDTSFSAGALAFAVAQAQQSTRYTPAMLRLVRWVIGIVCVVFGVEHFLHAQNVPVVPLEQLMPAWIPGHAALAYVTGTVMIACGAEIVWGAKARLAATWLGIYCVAVVLLVYLPMLLAKPGDIGVGMNYLADTMVFCGCALVLAEALPGDARTDAAGTLSAEPERGMGIQQRGEA
jgi:uncharacterized membrane protein